MHVSLLHRLNNRVVVSPHRLCGIHRVRALKGNPGVAAIHLTGKVASVAQVQRSLAPAVTKKREKHWSYSWVRAFSASVHAILDPLRGDLTTPGREVACLRPLTQLHSRKIGETVNPKRPSDMSNYYAALRTISNMAILCRWPRLSPSAALDSTGVEALPCGWRLQIY